ncbi:hypothetical protein [Rhizohabitans arisaemae]|uniref:hypothetical protein n=1 Tax=Rhizohabitans arisaemae TaxID=2720610 RepID=UPI0024B19175|nr:hypothetical protein [Rhizohabitans arisaemae]
MGGSPRSTVTRPGLGKGRGRLAVRVPAFLAVAFLSWFALGLADMLDTGWKVLVMGFFGLILLIAPIMLYVFSGKNGRMGWPTSVGFVLILLLFYWTQTVPGDWYLQLFGERVTAVVTSERERVDGNAVFHDHRLARPDGRPLNGRLESWEAYPVGESVLVLADPLGVFNPRHRGGWAETWDIVLTPICFAGLVVVGAAAVARGERDRRRAPESQS